VVIREAAINGSGNGKSYRITMLKPKETIEEVT
jgi:hypothetical protein